MIPRRRAHTYEGEWQDLQRCFKGQMPEETLVSAWEQAVADYVGAPQAAAISSGRRGMSLIFEHLGLAAGNEVIVPAYTLKDLLPLIQHFGAQAIPADIDPDSLAMSPYAVGRRITPRTKAILALHPFGAPCAIDAILDVANRHGVPVIEDCAHSLGATFQGKQTGTFGYAGFFSFEPTKPVNTYGGGMVVSADRRLIERIRRENGAGASDVSILRKKAQTVRTEQTLFRTGLAFPFLFMVATPSLKALVERAYRGAQQVPSGSARYLPIQAQLGLRKLVDLDARVARRRQRAALLSSLLKDAIRPQRILPGTQSTYYFYVVKLPVTAASIRRRMLLHGIDAALEGEIADDCGSLLEDPDCPVIRELFPRLLALPMYDTITEAEIHRVAKRLNALV